MGNVAMVCGGRPGGSTEPVEPRVPVTVLQSNGNVLSLYSSRVRVVDLILDYPNHFVCHSSSLVLLHHSKILPLHTLLVPGEVYFLLPMPNRPQQQDNESDTSSLLHIEPPRRAGSSSGSTTKFVISTEQFSRIMAGSIKAGKGGALSSSSSSSSGKRNRHHGRSGSSGKTTTTTKSSSSSSSGNSITAPIAAPWRPALSSIEEVAAN